MLLCIWQFNLPGVHSAGKDTSIVCYLALPSLAGLLQQEQQVYKWCGLLFCSRRVVVNTGLAVIATEVLDDGVRASRKQGCVAVCATFTSFLQFLGRWFLIELIYGRWLLE